MRHQHNKRVIQLGLLAVLFGFAACAEEPQPTPAAGLLADYASGVDASFGVETFNLGEPTITVTAPLPDQEWLIATGGQQDVEFKFTTQNFTPGKINCYLDGKLVGATTGNSYTFVGIKMGYRTLSCVLVDNTGTELTNKEATAKRLVVITHPCQVSDQCDDGLACSIAWCIGLKCKFEMTQFCCTSDDNCLAGEVCKDPNTAASQCTVCLKDGDCDDKNNCTADTCDQSGVKGVCKHVKTDKECCISADIECDDGKGCTVDTCDVATGKCKHVQPVGSCCQDTECSTTDTCLLGKCVDYECRFDLNKFRPDCCSTGTNTKCDDANYCTIDTCDQPQDDGWKKCSHTKDASKPNCCDTFKQTEECQDGDECTWDYCEGNQCYNIQIPGCCANDKECDDSNLCTADKCITDNPDAKNGQCKHTKTAGCCNTVVDCDDGLFCTWDTCDQANHLCSYPKKWSTCCDVDTNCDDGKVCTGDKCINNACIGIKDKFKPNCCDSSADCSDGLACTVDSCDTSSNDCKFVDNGDTACCNTAEDCSDGKCETLDFCGTDNKCTFKADLSKCVKDADCNDGKPCTTDSCDASAGACGACKFVPKAACCEFNDQCSDGNPCTADACTDNACKFTPIADCCKDDKDALTACDDKNPCTIDYCLNNSCRHASPKGGCCVADSGCDDGWDCTVDTCKNIVGGQGTCDFAQKAECECTADTQCDDKNKCTQDKCVAGACSHPAIQGCCTDAFDCSDGNACTKDYCIFDQCVSFESTGNGGLCCSVENEQYDCADLTSQCKVGKCKTQPDGSRSCVAEAKAVCTFELNYCQDFSESSDLKLMGWNPADVKGTAATNWAVGTDGGLGPDKYARFTWSPIKVDYDTCLQSPIFQAAGATTITIQLDREFIKNSGDSTIRVLGSLDGASADWTKGVLIDTVTPAKDIAAETMSVKLPPELSGSNGLRLAVCVSGGSTYNLTRFGVDNFCVAKGSVPAFTSCPANQTVLAGTTQTIPVKAKDADLSDIISFQLVKAPAFVSISSALYYWIDASWNSSLTLTPQPTDIGEHEVTIKVTDGFLYKLCTFKITVSYEGGVLVWKPSEVPTSNATPVYNAIKKLGKQVQVASDLGLYKKLGSFDAIFILLGVFPDNHVLKDSEVDGLKLYLSGGGRIYIEGGDTWAFDSATTLHSFFKVTGVLDSASNGVTGPLDGFMSYADVATNKNYKWAYQQGFTWNNLNDQIAGKLSVQRTGNLLRNSGIEKFWVHVAHDNTIAKYRTIASSILFGGVTSSTDTPDDLMKLIFGFFDNGFKDCTSDAQCNDGDGCTIDACSAGTCAHNNTCLCSAQTAFTCGDKPTGLVTNGSEATNIVTSYKCAAGVTLSGKEIAYTFSSAKSVPVVLTLTNVSSDKAKVFVLKETAKGCDPSSCLAYGNVASGKASVAFPAAAGTKYYIVVDAVGATDTAKFDLTFDCTSGEICTDGIDNNNNGKTDCDDWASCCGHASCGEVCDGIDNDCDSEIDEDCDADGDGFCALNAKVKKSAKCIKSKLPTDDSAINGDDCADADGTVNPKAAEICNNGKDDNCDGQQDEENASGCTNFYADLDGDGYGKGAAKCLCTASGAFKATKGGDCNDADKTINPGATELCSTSADDNCSGSNNDLNATGCKNFYTDQDSDDWGTTPFKCICTADGVFKSTKPGDCDDSVQPINPGATESCNNADDDCDGVVDEGCDDDGDGYCDVNLVFDNTQTGIKACPKGGGDTVDTDNKINPEGKEICDDQDNDSDGKTDEGCDDDGDTYCDSTMIVVGKPKSCVLGGGDCNDLKIKVNPGVKEDCATADDDNCNGSTNDVGAVGCKPFFYDGDKDLWGTNASQCLCTGKAPFDAINPGDCQDNNAKVNPGVAEICNDLDDNCSGAADEGCDDDGDKYCEAGFTIVGTPKICGNGGGDCADDDAAINPGKAEVCGDGKDNNCDGSQNDENAVYCIKFYTDADSDTYGTGTPKCFCAATGSYKTTKSGDCDDTSATIKPGVVEICDGKDNNCDGKTDEGCDDDGDGYCDANLVMVGTPAICKNGGGDCDDNNATIYKGKASETCDDKDDDCNGVVDNGCDDDKDGYCDSAHKIGSPPGKVCSKGTDDCDDFNFDVHPGAVEVCNNKIDDDCDGSQNDENAAGCLNFYFDADNDAYGITAKKCLCVAEGFFRAKASGDCVDNNANIKPGATETCDGVDNDCNNVIDDENATGCKIYYLDNDKDGYGLAINKCLCQGANGYTAIKKDDCNDSVKAVNPGGAEICNDVDDNCNGAVDEGCNKDGDDYCDKAMTTVGFPNVCKKGGGDCNDKDPNVSKSGVEICDNADNDCDGTTDEGCDDDNDDYCDSNLKIVGTPSTCSKGGGDCNDDQAQINPGKPEVCGNTVDENCNGSYNDVDADQCTNFYLDKDSDAYGKNGTLPKCMCIKLGDYKATKSGDCDDANYLINGGIAELCDGVDNNCNGTVDEGCDDDGDGYCDTGMITIGTPAICKNGGGDCDDKVKAINPGAKEICGNLIDENCDNSLNSNDAASCTTYYYDGDKDGFGVSVSQCLCTPEGNFNATKAGDCDDTKASINPNAVEVCGDGLDNNCNGSINEVNATNCIKFYKDVDKDGYGGGTVQCQCVAEGDFLTTLTGDCNDNDNTVKPGGTEICDAEDNNCNGKIDEGCDVDGDDHCSSKMLMTTKATCIKSTPVCNGVTLNNICYQAFPTKKTQASSELSCGVLGGKLTSINGSQENTTVRAAITKGCGSTAIAWTGADDSATEGVFKWSAGTPFNYTNWNGGAANNTATNDGLVMLADGTWSLVSPTVQYCYVCKLGKVNNGNGDDCDDTNKAISPSAEEVCDDKDNNCDGKKDDGCDGDGDGYCKKGATIVGTPAVCSKGSGDCDDTNSAVYPGKSEICDGADNDCDGQVDTGCDNDNDDYCTTTKAVVGTPAICPKGAGDCDDESDKVNPGATEVCGDKLDNNCAGGVDENCNDGDGDGYCTGTQAPSIACPKGGGDCDDTNKLVHPGMKESCTTVADDNCNGLTNEEGATNCKEFYPDEDKDGFGAGTKKCMCSQDAGASALVGGDCDDTNATINPNAIEICDGVDNTCTGTIDKGCDADGDGFCASGMLITDNVSCPKTGTLAGPGCTVSTPTFTGTVVNMDTRSHGGGFHPFRKEFWYQQWAGTSVYRYDVTYKYLGAFTGGRSYNFGLQGDLIEDAWYSASGYYNTIDRFEGMKSGGPTWSYSIGSTAGGVAVDDNFVYGMRQSGNGVYVLARKTGQLSRTFNLSAYTGTLYGGLAVHKGKLYRGTSDQWVYRYDLQGLHDGMKFQVAPNIYNAAFTGTQLCYSANSSSVYCYDLGEYNCKTGDDCVDTDKTINPAETETCDDKDNNCNSQVDEGCDNDNDNYCSSTAKLPFGNCCSGHVGTGCSVTTIQSCLCAKPGYGYCCTAGWDAKCAAAVKSTGCDACKFPSTCPAGGNDCDDSSNVINPAAKESCATPGDDNCDGKTSDINSEGCTKFYIDADADKYGGTAFQCMCLPEGKYTATVTGDCDDTNPAIYNGIAAELCDNKDNNCNGKTDEGCDDDGDGYCDEAKVVIDNTVCPKSPESAPKCGDELVSKDGLTPVTIGLDHKSYGGGYHAKRKEFWYPEYAASNTTVYRYEVAAPYTPTGNFKSGLAYIRQITNDGLTDDWFAAVYNSSSSGGVVRMSGLTSTKKWSSSSSTSYLSGVAYDAGTVYAMRYNSGTVYAFNATNGVRDTSKQFNLSTYTGSTYGIGIIGGHFYRTSDSAWLYRHNFASGTKGAVEAVRIKMTQAGHAVAATSDRMCSAAYNGMTTCYALPASNESYTIETQHVANRSHGAGYHHYRKEYWYPSWSSPNVYRYTASRKYIGSFDSGQSQMMQVNGDRVGDYWYSANWGYNTITRRDGIKNQSPTWSRNIGSTAGGVATDGTYVYAARNSGTAMWKLNKTNGAIVSTFNLSGWYTNSLYGGLFYHNSRLYRATSNNYVGRYQMNGKFDNLYFQTHTSIYTTTWDGKHACFTSSGTDDYLYCYTLPSNNTTYSPNTYSSGNSAYTYAKYYNMNTRSHGGGYMPQQKEFWYPEWAGATIYRYNDSGSYLGAFGLPYSQMMQLWGEPDGTFYTANWGYYYARGYNANKTIKWNYYHGYYMGGIACDTKNCFVMRHNNSTVWVLDRNTGGVERSYGLSGWAGSTLYGGLAVIGDSLIRGSSGNYIRTFNKFTGAARGISFRAAVPVYNMAFRNGQMCVSANNSSVYCYDMTDQTGKDTPLLYGDSSSVQISSYNHSHGMGYHPYYKEHWKPSWAGERVYRYDQNRNYVGQFDSGRTYMMDLTGETTNDDWYSANWQYYTIRKHDGMLRKTLWDRSIGYYAGAVATEGNYVYGIRHGSNYMYKLDKSNGSVVSSFGLTGGSYMSDTMYGGAAVIGTKLYRASSSGYVERYDLTTQKYDGLTLYMGTSHYGTSFQPDIREFCTYDSSDNGQCVTLPATVASGSAGVNTVAGIDTYSYGGGFHAGYSEYWYPEWNSANATQVYRYDQNAKYLGSFNSGLQYVRQIAGDKVHTDYYAGVYSGSSTYSRVYRLKAKTNTKVWTSPYATTYYGGMAIDANYVYTMRYDGDRHVYAFNRSNGAQRTDKEFDVVGDLNGGNCYGIAIYEGKLYRTSTSRFVYRYDMVTHEHDGVKFETTPTPDTVALNDKGELCVSVASSPAVVYCYPLKDVGTNWNATTYTVPTYGEGAGFHNYRAEFWFNNWSSGTTRIYRYNKNKVALGAFDVAQRYIRQTWGDIGTDHYYSANWSDSTIQRRAGMSPSVLWSRNIGGNPGGVAGDDTAVYAMRYNSQTVYQLNKLTGAITRQFNLTGSYSGSLYGGLAVSGGKLFRGNTSAWVYRYDLATGEHDNVKFTTAVGIYGAAFDGQNYCVHDSSSSNQKLYCYEIVTTNCTKGTDCDDTQASVNPGKTEICDDLDNNCSGTVDTGCDDDSDGYCDANMATYGTPTVCPKGGGDCNDASATESPASPELCDGKDNNCNKLIDEENATGCSTYFYDGDNDGVGLTASSKCLCKAQDLYKTTVSGDCNDTCSTCAPNKPEICDGQDNDCDAPLLDQPSLATTKLTFNSSNLYYGGCWHSKRNEYWFTYWSGAGMYRYNASGNYLGAMSTGQSEMMGLACDDLTDDYYTANWGQQTVTRRAGTSTKWARNIYYYPAGVAYEGSLVYAMKYYYNITTVYRMDRASGAAKGDFNLSGWGQFSSSSIYAPYDGLEVVDGKLWRITQNRYAARYNLTNGKFDGVYFYVTPGSSYVNHSFIKDGKLCVGSYGRNDMYCYELPDSNLGSLTRNLSMNTYSYGGGYHPRYSEFWYNNYNNSTIYRYDNKGKALGSFNGGHTNVRQISATGTEDAYYMARYGSNSSTSYIVKNSGKTATKVWQYSPATYLSAVSVDGATVYAQRYYSSDRVVYMMKATDGQNLGNFSLGGDIGSYNYGGLLVTQGKLYRATSDGWVRRYDMKSKAYDGLNLYYGNWHSIYNLTFDGNEMCLSSGSSSVFCYQLTGKGSLVDENCDPDGDGYCDANILTIGKPKACPKGGADCDETSKSINPSGTELCNGKDENCNGAIDEGADTWCEDGKNAQAKCESGACKIYECNTNYVDLNGLGSDGCECLDTDGFEPNDTCSQAVSVDTNMDDNGVIRYVTARLVSNTDQDWFSFRAIDSTDSGTAVCDRFNVRVRFVQNPSNSLRFEIYRGGCPGTKYPKEAHNLGVKVDNAVCCGQTDFNWFTNFKGYQKNAYSSYYSEWGECNCTTSGSTFDTRTGYNYGPGYNPYGTGSGGPWLRYNGSSGVTDRNVKSQSRGYDYSRCHNDTAYFYIKVYKGATATQCSNYRLEISNGVYGAPSNGRNGYMVN